MEEHYLQTLELNKVLDRLAGQTAFSVSNERALALRPATEMVEVLRRQSATAEARRLLDLKPNFSVGGARDIRAHLQRASIGALLTPDELLLVASTIGASRQVRGTIAKLGDQLPTLEEVTLPIGAHDDLEREIRRTVTDAGEVADSASPELAQIRIELRRAHERLMAKLQEITSSSAYRTVLQEPIVTQRNGRYVVPVKAEFKGQMKGIVHDQSASGATVFMEPLVVVDLANRWRQLQIDEEREVERILRTLAGLVGREAEGLGRTLEAVAEVDLYLAKAKLAEAMRASTPLLLDLSSITHHSSLPCIRLVNARHPLLSGHVVPISVELGGDFDVLVITGPNTGGKTVALKTVGLLCLMAQCGLQIPADEGSAVGIFRAVYADIGDEQSIEQSLSTFSSHVTRIVDILGKADERSLVLLDELGAGTDPQEGSALARAILSHLLERRVPTIATTHYSELKSFAHTTPRVQNASVEFDLETLSPTYRLSIGLPGRSNALAIAKRLGMKDEILEGARQLLQPGELEIEGLLSQLQTDRDQAREARVEAERLRDRARAQRSRLNAELAEMEDRKQTVFERAREQSEHELAALRQKVQQVMRELERSRLLQGDAQAGVAAAAERAERLRPVHVPRKRQPQPQRMAAQELKIGQSVFVPGLQSVGTVASLPDGRGEVEVQLGAIRTRVKAGELSRTDQRGATPEREPEITYRVDMDRAAAVSLQLDLRGRRADEAQEELDHYLHDAYMAGMKVVRIIHGKGTGAVRQAVRTQLAASPLVSHFEPADAREGGDGATVVSLAN